MPLSSDLVAQFTKVTNDSKRETNDGALNGTIIKYGDSLYVRLDGSNEITPIARTVEVAEGDRVQVAIKNHTAVVTGNTTDPAIGVIRADELETRITQTAEELRLEAENTVEQLESSISMTAEEIRSEVSNAVNGLNSSITQTANEIRSEVSDVSDEVGKMSSSIKQNADNITSLVTKNNEFSEFQQTVEGFSFMGKGGTVKISGGDITLSGSISFADLTDGPDIIEDINEAKSSAASASTTASNALTQSKVASNTASNAATTASNALETISGFLITEGAETYINGRMIYTNSIYASSISCLGGELTVYKTRTGGDIGGYLGYCAGFNSGSGIGMMHGVNQGQCVCTDQAARLSFGGNSQFVASAGSVTIDGKNQIYFEISNSKKVSLDYITADGCGYFRPYPGSGTVPKMYLGSPAAPWAAVYASTGTVSTSDRNQKNSIEDLPEKYVEMYNLLQPKRFKLNSGTSDRYHVGYIAQDVEEAMIAVGIDSQEFGGIVKDKDNDGNDVYLLRYGEFDAIRDAKIKQLEAKNEELEERVKNLENLVAQLLNKT